MKYAIGILIFIAVFLIIKRFSSKPGLDKKELLNRLPKEFTDAPVVTLVGVVDASDAGGGHNPGEEYWTLSFDFAVWRVEGESVRETSLRIHRPVTEDELDQFMEQIKSDTVLRIRAYLDEITNPNVLQAVLVELDGIEQNDAELNEWVKRLQEPVTFEDELFGTLTLDRSLRWYETQANWLGKPVKLNLDAGEEDELQSPLDTATSLWKSQEEWNERIRQFAVKELLPIKNEYWLDEDESAVPPEVFLERMSVVESITVNSDGSFTFWHKDGDLFFGHAIMVEGTITNGPTDADIPG